MSASLKCGPRQSDHIELKSMHLTANQLTASFAKKASAELNSIFRESGTKVQQRQQQWPEQEERLKVRQCAEEKQD